MLKRQGGEVVEEYMPLRNEFWNNFFNGLAWLFLAIWLEDLLNLVLNSSPVH